MTSEESWQEMDEDEEEKEEEGGERKAGEDPWESLKQEHDECTARSF